MFAKSDGGHYSECAGGPFRQFLRAQNGRRGAVFTKNPLSLANTTIGLGAVKKWGLYRAPTE